MTLDDKELRNRIEELGPWHHNIHIRNEVYTQSSSQSDGYEVVALINPKSSFEDYIERLLPNGMEGRSFLDCACNGGGYCFAAKDMGAGEVYGFDVREHWINQAKFVAENREADSSGITFEVMDLMDFEADKTFDVCLFSGIFYHLPDPIAGLKRAADKTKEILILNTAIAGSEPDEEEIPGLVIKNEGTKHLMSGVYGPSWLPSGPIVLKRMLRWFGFPEIRIVMWVRKQSGLKQSRSAGRIAIIAAREKGRLNGIPNVVPVDVKRDPRAGNA